MSKALRNLANAQKAGRTASPQMERTPGRTDEVKNNAGGYVFKVGDKDRLERFLILGTDGGTYYVGEADLTKQNAKFVSDLIKKDEALVLNTVVDVSENGRAYKNSPAIFVMAMLMTEGTDKAAVRAALPRVARTSTHLFEFAEYVDSMGGWGRSKRNAIADWYTDKDADKLAYQAVKYRGGRNGWTHRDLFRKSHPQGVDQGVGNFILGKPVTEPSEILEGFRRMQGAGSVKNVLSVLDMYPNLPWETIPTEFLKEPDVWKKLFHNGALRGQALVRNITRLSRIGAFNDMMFAAEYAARLADEEMIRQTRLHPINFLNALVVHEEGQMNRSGYYYGYGGLRNKNWDTVPQIVDALNSGFHSAFKSVESTGKRTMLAVDVSGSMGQGAMGLDLSCAQVSGAMAMTIARTEPAHIIRGFTSNGGYGRYGRDAELTDLGISARTSLSVAMNNVQKSNFGGTDASLPMVWAKKQGVEVDTFVVITDNETWAGRMKPVQALRDYRKATGIDARLAVLGVASTGFTIADPTDRGMMDFVGFDANAPRALADFSAGRI